MLSVVVLMWQPAAVLHLPTLHAKSTSTQHIRNKQPVCACNAYAYADRHAMYPHMGSLTAGFWPYACGMAHSVTCVTSIAA